MRLPRLAVGGSVLGGDELLLKFTLHHQQSVRIEGESDGPPTQEARVALQRWLRDNDLPDDEGIRRLRQDTAGKPPSFEVTIDGCSGWQATEDASPMTLAVRVLGPGSDGDPEALRFSSDGKQVGLAERLPDVVDGSRGAFSILLSESDQGAVYRLGWHCEDMYDSSVFLWRQRDGDWVCLGKAHKDSGGRITVNYSGQTNTSYRVTWTDAPIVNLTQETILGERFAGSSRWRWKRSTRPGAVTPSGVAWASAATLEEYTTEGHDP